MSTTVRFISYPKTNPPPGFVLEVANVFRKNESGVATKSLKKGLTSDKVLQMLRPDLESLGFEVESGKKKDEKIHRPVLFGEDGVPQLRYEIDAYHSAHRCGLEVEAGRGWMGNAVYRDLILAGLMVGVDHLIIAVANEYWYKTGGKDLVNKDYDYAKNLADTVFSQGRLNLPYGLTILGY